MAHKRVYYEDPSIAAAAAVEAREIWWKIELMIRSGMGFFRAREIVLAIEIPRIVKTMGKDTANRVSREIHHHGPHELSPETRRFVRRRLLREFMRVTDYRRRFGRMPWYDRLACKLTGQPWRA